MHADLIERSSMSANVSQGMPDFHTNRDLVIWFSSRYCDFSQGTWKNMGYGRGLQQTAAFINLHEKDSLACVVLVGIASGFKKLKEGDWLSQLPASLRVNEIDYLVSTLIPIHQSAT